MSSRPVLVGAFISASVCAIGLAVAAPASAAPTLGSFPLPAAAGGARPASAASPAPSPVAGYLGDVTGSRPAAVSYKVPTVTCTTDGSKLYATVGVGSTTATSKFIGVLLEMGCNRTKATYRVAVISQSATISNVLTVVPGDVLVVTAHAGTAPAASVTVSGTTTSAAATVPAFTADTAQFTMQAPATPFPTFSVVTFLRPKIGPNKLSASNPQRSNQVSAARKVEMSSSPFKANGSFNVKYVSQG